MVIILTANALALVGAGAALGLSTSGGLFLRNLGSDAASGIVVIALVAGVFMGTLFAETVSRQWVTWGRYRLLAAAILVLDTAAILLAVFADVDRETGLVKLGAFALGLAPGMLLGHIVLKMGQRGQ